jgi:nucleotide-binding universal stress UspA family protein
VLFDGVKDLVLKTILVAIDSSLSNERVLEALQQFNLQSTAQIIFSHVIPTQVSDFEAAADHPHPSLSELPYQTVEKQLQVIQQQLTCPSQIEVVRGDPSEEIIRLANIYKANLIIIGSRGLTGMNRVLKGSVSAQVVAEADCSVLVLKG